MHKKRHLQYLDFSLNLLLLHGLQDFDDAALVAGHIDALKHLAVLAAPHFPHHLIVVLR
jgi:hypothetical protein